MRRACHLHRASEEDTRTLELGRRHCQQHFYTPYRARLKSYIADRKSNGNVKYVRTAVEPVTSFRFHFLCFECSGGALVLRRGITSKTHGPEMIGKRGPGRLVRVRCKTIPNRLISAVLHACALAIAAGPL